MDEVRLVDRLEPERELVRRERREHRLPVRRLAQRAGPDLALGARARDDRRQRPRTSTTASIVASISSSPCASEGKQTLVLARRDVDAALEQPAEELAVALRVELREPLDRLVAAGEERQHRADALHAAERREPVGEPRGAALELVVDLRVAQPPQHREAGRGRERVPAQRARLVDGAGRRELLHHLGAAAERGERQAAADDLPEHRQVGRDAEPLLRAAARDAEAGDHLVEDEQRARRVAEQPQRLEEARARRARSPCSRRRARR